MKKSFKLFIIQLVSLAMILLFNILLARNLNPADYGDFSTAYSFSAIAYVICLLGADITAFKFISVAYKDNKISEVKSYLFFVLACLFITTVVFYGICFLSYYIAKEFFHLKNLHAVFVVAIFIPFMSLCNFLYKVMISIDKAILSSFLYKFFLNFSIIVLILVALGSSLEVSSNLAILLVSVPWVVTLVIFLYLLNKSLNMFSLKRSKVNSKEWLMAGLSSMPFSMSLMCIANLGVISAELFLANENMVGVFASAAWIAQLFNNIFVSLAFTISLSDMSVAISTNDYSTLKSCMLKHLKNYVVISLAYLLIIIFFGKNILGLFGSYYTEGYSVLIWLVIMQVIVVLCCLALPVLNYMRKYKLTSSFSILLIVIVLPLAYLLSIPYQEDGIAMALLISVILGFLLPQIYLMGMIKRKLS